jgi:hypothetical protein
VIHGPVNHLLWPSIVLSLTLFVPSRPRIATFGHRPGSLSSKKFAGKHMTILNKGRRDPSRRGHQSLIHSNLSQMIVS